MELLNSEQTKQIKGGGCIPSNGGHDACPGSIYIIVCMTHENHCDVSVSAYCTDSYVDIQCEAGKYTTHCVPYYSKP